jgi:hypothetical protein
MNEGSALLGDFETIVREVRSLSEGRGAMFSGAEGETVEGETR